MGWTFTNKPNGMSFKDFFSDQFIYKNPKFGEVQDVAVKDFVAYIAIKREWGAVKDHPMFGQIHIDMHEVFAIVCPIRMRSDYYNIGYKDMSEDMGPFYYDCPERILKQLTPTGYQYAIEWRNKCWEKINKRKNTPRLSKDTIIKLNRPVKFRNGCSLDTFKVISTKPLRFVSDNSPYTHYIINRKLINEIGFKIIK